MLISFPKGKRDVVMKLKSKITKVGIIALASLTLTVGVAAAAASSIQPIEAGAYYSPSTHYSVSDTASELASYYSTISDSDTGTSLLTKLQSLNSTKRKKTVGYDTIGTDTNDAVIYTDYDLNSTRTDSNGQTYGTKVASFYTKTASTFWNREHVWPNSHGGNKVEDDILHTRPTISSENSSRGNSFYVEGKNSSSAGWDPYTAGYDAAVRGECARIILYSVVAYSGFSLSAEDSHSTSNANPDYMMGNMHTLIKWHYQYSPNVYEINRNNGAEYLQGNRNPFVDHPEYVARIWSDYDSTVSSLVSENESMYDNWTPGSASTYGSNDAVNAELTISATSKAMTVDETSTISATSSNSSTITWTTSNSSVVSISSGSAASGSNITLTAKAAGTATITAKATIDGTQHTKTCAVTVSASGGSGSSSGNGDIVISPSDLDSSYPSTATTYTTATGNMGFTAYYVYNNNAIQFKKSQGYLYNNSSLNLASLTIKSASNGNVNVYGGTTIQPSGTAISPSVSGSDYTYDLSGCNYFKISQSGTEYTTCSSIEITLASSSTKTLSSIAVKAAPTKTTYTAGEYFAPAGLKITLTYSDSTTEDVTYSTSNSSSFTFSPSTSTALTTSNTSVTITYGGKSTSQAITVNAAQVTTYIVTYDGNGKTGGSVPTDSTSYNANASVTVKGNTGSLVKDGYTFAGWTLNSSGTGTVYGPSYTTTYTINSNTTFYAKWTENSSGGEETTGTGTINFGTTSGYTSVNAASVTGDDSLGNTWTVTTVGTSSFTTNASYSQIGSSNSPATSVTFTTTLDSEYTITAFSAKFGGFNSTAGTITLKVGDDSVGTGSLNASSDVTVSATDATKSSNTLTVSVTGIKKGIKVYYISYSYSSSGSSGSGDNPSGTSAYSLVTGSLNAGDKVYIAAKKTSGEYYVLGNSAIATYYLKSTLGTVSDNKLSSPTSDMTLWTVGKSDSSYTFTAGSDTSKYLNSYVSDTHYNVSYEGTSSHSGNVWTYSDSQLLSNENVYLTHLLYVKNSTTTPEFTGLNTTPTDYTICFFRETVQYSSDEFAQIFVNSITCDSTGNTAPVLTKSWADLKDVYNAISSTAEKNKLLYADFSVDGETVTPASGTTQVVANAMSKYDILISKYASTYTDNFIGRPASAQQNLFITQSESSTTMMIVIVSIISISAISGFIFLKKRKEN